MRLESVEIRDYRSIFLEDGGQPFRLDLADGANTLVGQNNCGKSNVLRAISLAIDPQHEFDPDMDVPGPRSFSFPIITLGFRADPSVASDQGVLDAVETYRASFVGRDDSQWNHDDVIQLRVSFVPTGDGVRRVEQLVGLSDGGTSGPATEELLTEAIDALRTSIRFVLISSGESIECAGGQLP